MPNDTRESARKTIEFTSDIVKYNLRKLDSSTYTRIGLFLIIAIFIAGLAYAFLRINQEFSTNKSATPAQTDSETSNLEEQTKIADLDQQRKNDIFVINSSLQAYYLEKEALPSTIGSLVPDFLGEVPKDPETGAEYVYAPSDDRKSWTLSVILSDGTIFELTGP